MCGLPVVFVARLLFVCTANLNRSPTAAELFRDSPQHEAKSAGVHPAAATRLTRQAVEWADKVFVMEDWHARKVEELAPGADVEVLGIPDVYPRGDPQLQELLRKKLSEYLG